MFRARVEINVRRKTGKIITKRNTKKWTSIEALEAYKNCIQNNLKDIEHNNLTIDELNQRIVAAIKDAQKLYCTQPPRKKGKD